MPFPSLTAKFHQTVYGSLSPSRPELSSKGKNVVITGGGSGIGRETALYFAKAGAQSVSIIGRNTSSLQRTKDSIQATVPKAQILTYSVDVTQKADLVAAFGAINAGVGLVHVLVCNAGYVPTPMSVQDADDDDWWRSFEVNVKGPFLTVQAFLQFRSPDAVVIYVSSALSYVTAGPNKSSYSAAKAGAVRLFTALQSEQPGLRVISLHPGTIETESLRRSGWSGGNTDDVELPAAMMVWLASPEAAFLRGKYIWANWDVDEMMARSKEIAESNIATMQLSGWPFLPN